MFLERLQRRAARYRVPLSASVAMFLLVACGGGGDSTDPGTTLSISPASATVSVDESTQFSALNAQGTVTWSSSNESIATVVSTGFTTGHAPGTATITAKDSRGSTTATVTVKSAAALVLSSNAVSFTQQTGSADAPSQVVQITDGGDNKVGAISIAGISAPAGQPTSWLTATLSGAATPSTLTLHATAGALAPGVYSATVAINAVGAKNGDQSVVVTFTVTAPAAIQLSASTLAFTQVRGASATTAQTVNVTNSGGGTLSAISASIAYQTGQTGGWLTATLSAVTGSATLTVQPTVGSLPNGTYNATIAVAATGASNSPRTIAVTFVVAAQPAINLSSGTLTFNAVRGTATPAQTIAVNNSGGGTLADVATAVRYTQAQSTGWLTVTSDATTSPANISVTPAVGALTDGTYNVTIDVTASNASNSPQSVAVTMVVTSSGIIVLSSQSLTFGASTGGANPAAQTVNVTSSGGTEVSGLSTSIVYPAGQPTGWLTSILSGESSPATITIQPATGALPSGTYTATVRVASTTASNSPRNVSVSFTVSATPLIAFSSNALTFSTTRTTEAATQNVGVTNIGGGNLTGLVATVAYQSGQPTGWLTATLSATTATANLTVQSLVSGLPNGTYNATISVASAVAGNSPRTIAVSFTITSAPTIGLSTQTIAFAATTGGASPAAQTVNITNAGGGTLAGLATSIAYTGASTGWLAASLSATAVPSVLTLTATTGALAAGTYTATVSVTAPGATNSPAPVTVTFTVAPQPSLVLGSNSSSTSATRSQTGNPVATPIAVTRLGGGSLTGLTATVSSSGSGWLTVSLNTTTTPATLTITTNANSLSPSATPYSATVTVTSPDATNGPQTIAVSFTALWSYSLDIYPAIASSCSSCHSSAGNATIPQLDSAALFYRNQVNQSTVPSGMYALAASHNLRIKPGDAANSYLIDELSRTAGSDFMPPTASATVTNLIPRIIAWINQGAKNN